VTLSSTNAAATVPASVTVVAGQTVSPSFTVTTQAVASTTTGNISATFNGSTQSAALTVNAPAVVFSISGTLSGVNGATVTLSAGGTTVATTLETTSGTFSFSNLANGSYVVTPSLASYVFNPTSTAVIVNGANVTGVSFSASDPETLFTTQTPAITGASDGSNVNYELGTLLQSDIAGQITAIRFWKDANETGTHTGHIWSSSGTLLATVTFTSETASGWQVQNLTTPLAITANTSYVVSVNTGNTYYVATTSGLASKVTNVDLSTVVGNNGVFASAGSFPTGSWESTNYFRDVVFTH
jgi:hypothetical protein